MAQVLIRYTKQLIDIVTRRVTEYLQEGSAGSVMRPHTLLQVLKVTLIHVMGLLGLFIFSVLHGVVDMTHNSF